MGKGKTTSMASLINLAIYLFNIIYGINYC